MTHFRRTFAEVSLDAVTANTRAVAAVAAPAALWAVVKADGYGHGAAPVATAARTGGASGLAVATVEEAIELRRDGLADSPILLLSEPPAGSEAAAAAAAVTPTVYSLGAIERVATSAGDHVIDVHLKVDTGMHRVGCRPDQLVDLARAIENEPRLRLGGTWTHLAVADELDSPATDTQLDRFDAALATLRTAGLDPGVRHTANSAGTIAWPRARLDLVRCGIALYGVDPAPALADRVALRPALRLVSTVTHVQWLESGEGVSYGHLHRTERPTWIATVAIGYADGVSRRLSTVGGEVLIGGRRRSLIGRVTMDQVMVDCGDDPPNPGDEVVLIGGQGDETITANDLADRLDTVGYEILTSIGPRVPRVYV